MTPTRDAFLINSNNFFLFSRSDAGQRPTAASSAEVAEEVVRYINDLNLESLSQRQPTQHSRRHDDDDGDDDNDEVARSVRFHRRRSGHSRGRR